MQTALISEDFWSDAVWRLSDGWIDWWKGCDDAAPAIIRVVAEADYMSFRMRRQIRICCTC
jgi:hypothetical protein